MHFWHDLSLHEEVQFHSQRKWIMDAEVILDFVWGSFNMVDKTAEWTLQVNASIKAFELKVSWSNYTLVIF